MSKLSLTKRNVVSNLAGRGYVALLNFALLPIYLRLLGPEAYGLIGLYVSLQTIVSLLDMGLSPTLTREMARLSAVASDGQEARDLVRTLEVVYWIIGVVIGASVFLLSPWIARHVVHAHTLPLSAIVLAIRIVGLLMVFQWPDSFYSGGLTGLQRQVTLNYIRVGIATLQSAGVLLILKWVSCTIQAYFWWQMVIWGVQTLLLIVFLWKSLPAAPHAPRIRRELWSKNARFTTGMTGIAITTIILLQLDKMILAATLPLAEFGYYSLASYIANCLLLIVTPIYAAVFPRFTQLAALHDEDRLARFYHQSCQLVSLVLLPCTILGVLFSQELLTIYLHNPVTVRSVQPLFCLLLVGTAFNCLVSLPFALQTACGWTKLPLYKNIAAVILYIPSLPLMIGRFGAAGAAALWVVLNVSFFLLEIPLMHRRLLRGEMVRWYTRDVAVPLGISVALGVFARFVLPARVPVPLLLLWLGSIAGAAMCAILFVTPWMRASLRRASA